MTDQDKFARFLPLAYQWAKTQEAFVLEHGIPLAPRQIEDAQRAGVQDPSRVRLLLVGRIPHPDDAELALVHVAQCERSGGLEPFIEEYLSDRTTCANFSVGSLEDEARGLAREICAAEATAR